MLFEQYHWKQARKKNQPYKFMVCYMIRLRSNYPWDIYSCKELIVCVLCALFIIYNLIIWLILIRNFCSCSGTSTWTRDFVNRTTLIGLFTSLRFSISVLPYWDTAMLSVWFRNTGEQWYLLEDQNIMLLFSLMSSEYEIYLSIFFGLVPCTHLNKVNIYNKKILLLDKIIMCWFIESIRLLKSLIAKV